MVLKVLDVLKIVVLDKILMLCFKVDLDVMWVGGKQLALCEQGET
jgi:hypothetical protein